MNQIHTHPEQPQLQAEVILASEPENNASPIYTLRLRYPRIIHGEIMTHRVFSRNARSSRAVPVRTMLDEVRNTPFVPWHWGKNQKGMQAGEECNEPVADWWTPMGNIDRVNAWCAAAIQASHAAEAFMQAGYHKQLANRLLEPFSWIDTLVTSTNWSNFLWLRDHKDAEPHLQDLARLVRKALAEAQKQPLREGQWHRPYVTPEDVSRASEVAPTHGIDVSEFLNRISAARCARISYKPFNGDASYGAELERYESLISSDRVHASPTEHQAQLATELPTGTFDSSHLSGNFGPGWIQARKLIPNEFA